MLAFLRRNQIFFSSCFCLLLSLYILTATARGQIKNEPVGALLMWILRPLQIAGQGTANWIKGFRDHYDTLAGFRSENERLRKRPQNLEIERQRLLEAEATNQQLQKLLDFRSELPKGAITATIIANSATSWFQSCVLNKGSADGVRKGMAVVTPLGIVGKVVAVTGRTAKILLLTDEELRSCYFSRQKIVYARELAKAIQSKQLRLKKFTTAHEDEVRIELKKIKGIGDWTVDVYLMHALQRTDLFPLGDIALVNSLKEVKQLHSQTTKEKMLKISEPWRPYRTIASMILWHAYIQKRGIKLQG